MACAFSASGCWTSAISERRICCTADFLLDRDSRQQQPRRDDNFQAAGKISLNAAWHAQRADGFFCAYGVGTVRQQQPSIVFKKLIFNCSPRLSTCSR